VENTHENRIAYRGLLFTTGDIEKYISWTSDDIKIDLNKPHFYHPVK
jgi:hypothetical protein